MPPRRQKSTLFPYTTLFRSGHAGQCLQTSLAGGATAGVGSGGGPQRGDHGRPRARLRVLHQPGGICRVAENRRDRKSTRLNSSHLGISYAVFCLKKKTKEDI